MIIFTIFVTTFYFKNMDKILIEMLGKNAFNNDMIIDSDMAKLVKTVNYLIAQLNITRRWCDEEGNEHIKKVLESAESILNGDN